MNMRIGSVVAVLGMLAVAPRAYAQTRTAEIEFTPNVTHNGWNAPAVLRLRYNDPNLRVVYHPVTDDSAHHEVALDSRIPRMPVTVLLNRSGERGWGAGIEAGTPRFGARAMAFGDWRYGYAWLRLADRVVLNVGGQYDERTGFSPTGYAAFTTGADHVGIGRTRFDSWWANIGHNAKELGVMAMLDFTPPRGANGNSINFDSFLGVGDVHTGWYNPQTQLAITHEDVVPKTITGTYNFYTGVERGTWSNRVRFVSNDAQTFASAIVGRRKRLSYGDVGAGSGIEWSRDGLGVPVELYGELRHGPFTLHASWSHKPRSQEDGLLVRAAYAK